MADAARNITIKVLLDEAKARMGLKQMGQDADDTGSRWSKMGGAVKAGIAVAGAVVVSFLKDATEAALADELAQKDLALALRNTVDATDEEIAATEEWIDATARATGVADDQLRPALETLTRATGDLEEAQGLLGTAMDIAAATGKPLQAVVDAISKAAQNGSTGGLARLGLKIKDVNGAALSLDEILQEATRTMGGAAAAAAETGAGSVARLQVAFEETKEEIGSAFIPILIEAADAVLGLMDSFKNPPDLKTLDPFTRSVADSNDGVLDLSRGVESLGKSFGALGDLLGITVAPVIGETYDVRSSARPTIREIEAAHDNLKVAIDDSTDAFYDHQDAIRASTDPVFALAEAEREQAEAIAAATAAAEEYGEGSPQHLDALGQVRDAAYDVKDAEREMGDQSGVTRETMQTNLRALGVYTEEQIQLMLDDFDRINAYTFQAKNIQVTHTVTGGGRQMQAGGFVPGSPGQSFPAVLHGGEQVIPAHQVNGRSRSGTPMNNHITINAGMGSDPNAISRALVEALQRYERANGPLPVHTR